ncbi:MULTISPECIES: hypothetical protein [unclassified Bosea (in: a-proteobacteria)]|uniref:hypothetical protein n=1 Tax=unclassified Bosea (in: a-proteobacteria) TaxID=2653178 RepID=UPI000F75C53F|nr:MULTISPECIES: hypothetical protein [unclassified Bosea (in: a-proteobacteria)]AZO79331.1 hypothetical protein BLM15_18255 [Bosea sp. Tri-49]RXT27256.1 hypothetical protein B5U98_00100 [Bosea sp. Tri-39]RXT36038.1 hypothetical protein B5U99_17900 [Bosea sp. Tri-54]
MLLSEYGSALSSRLLSTVTDMDVDQARQESEPADFQPQSQAAPSILETTPLSSDWRDLISPVAYEFIVRWETGGPAYYKQVIKEAPIWPGYASGVTIGCGYDLGYHTASQFAADWSSRLKAAAISRLSPAVGFKTVQPNRDAKVAWVKGFIPQVADIKINWDVAIEQFDTSKMPKLLRDLYGALDSLDRLHPHCRGALLSLVFNRGASFAAAGERYAEMREIARLMRTGGDTEIRQIPAQLRSMKRIWGENSSLAKRREGEAELFEAGLAESGTVGIMAMLASQMEAPEAAPLSRLRELPESETAPASDEIAEPDEEGLLEIEALAVPGVSPDSVKWNPDDSRQPDYAHLDGAPIGQTFTLRPGDLEQLITMNGFRVLGDPAEARIIFMLRGARLANSDKALDHEALLLTDQRPDHRSFRCVIGVYDRARQRLSAFKASTVPNAHYVFKCFSLANQPAKWIGNILPTGCYTFTVGTHKRGQPGEIPEVLRLSTSAAGASTVLVLRSLSDLIYDTMDHWQTTAPGDNIHPGQMSSGFSSAGCLTLPGFWRAGVHSGLWKEFRDAIGLAAGNNDGKQYSGVLLTGTDAALAASLRERAAPQGDIEVALRRLRYGSRGEAVGKLQDALGLDRDTDPMLGPITRMALVQRQQTMFGKADGILSPQSATALGLDVF